jgi:hypothetical protein
LATRARREVSRLIHGRGHKQAMRYLRKMRTWTGRLNLPASRSLRQGRGAGIARIPGEAPWPSFTAAIGRDEEIYGRTYN